MRPSRRPKEALSVIYVYRLGDCDLRDRVLNWPSGVHMNMNAIKCAVFICVCSSSVALAESWSRWEPFANGADVSVSVSRVNKDTWTWRFRNDGPRTITFMTFEYSDKDGTHKDVLPGNLAPHAVFGGWSAFTASSSPHVHLTKVKRD
jgi:hypothetical protein